MFKKAIEKNDEQWSYLISRPVGSKDYKEMYAFVWRFGSGACARPTDSPPTVSVLFASPSAQFRSKRDNSQLAVGTVHILYGRSIKERTPEIRFSTVLALDAEHYPDAALVLAGDFNLPPNMMLAGLKAPCQTLNHVGATTLGKTVVMPICMTIFGWQTIFPLDIAQAGIIAFPKMLKMDHQDSRKYMSDHVVYMSLGQAELDESVVTIITPDTLFMLPDSPEAIALRLDTCAISHLYKQNKSRRQKCCRPFKPSRRQTNKIARDKPKQPAPLASWLSTTGVTHPLATANWPV